MPRALLSDSEDEDEEQIIDSGPGPDGRYRKTNVILGTGAFKTVYKGYDTEEARSVAWNELKTHNESKNDRKAIIREVQLLKSMKHPSILDCYEWWITEKDSSNSKSKKKGNVVFIVEYLTGGTLKQYLQRAKSIRPSVIQNWASQILAGLNYLHNMEPPVIHRDLKCDNIFIHSETSRIKIGDMGLATAKTNSHKGSIIGTPEFMAPEMYDERYNEKVDIYAFGMCVLEMFTLQYPYKECHTVASIMKKVLSGVKPASVEQVTWKEGREMIYDCLEKDPDLRPSSRQLLSYPFITMTSDVDVGSSSVIQNVFQSTEDLSLLLSSTKPSPLLVSAGQMDSLMQLNSAYDNVPHSNGLARDPIADIVEDEMRRMQMANESSQSSVANLQNPAGRDSPSPSNHSYLDEDEVRRMQLAYETSQSSSAVSPVKCLSFVNETSDILQLMFETTRGVERRAVHFPFDLTKDTAHDIVDELIDVNIINEDDGLKVITDIEFIVSQFHTTPNQLNEAGGRELSDSNNASKVAPTPVLAPKFADTPTKTQMPTPTPIPVHKSTPTQVHSSTHMHTHAPTPASLSTPTYTTTLAAGLGNMAKYVHSNENPTVNFPTNISSSPLRMEPTQTTLP
eukprot:CFRG2963T1